MMMKIEQIWDELENDQSFTQGLLLRRFSGSLHSDVFVALKCPERLRCIAAIVSNNEKFNLTAFSNLRDITVELVPDEKRPNKSILLFILINQQHQDIFSVLSEDLMTSISLVINENELVHILLNRFEKWKSLFEKVSLQGLTDEQERGLWGELFFLRKFLQRNSNLFDIVNSWLGPEKQIRDFQYGSWGVEVKTTHGNNHQKVHISSERQLDISSLEDLFLYHLSLESRKNSGENLNQAVDSVCDILQNDFISLTRFKTKLLEAGFYDHQRNLYENTGYIIRQEVFYQVEGTFPRIEEKEIRHGVGDVKYSIILSQCDDFVKSEQDVFQKLIFS